MADSDNEIVIRISAKDLTEMAAKSAQKNVRAIGDAATHTAASTKTLGQSLRETGTQTSAFGRAMLPLSAGLAAVGFGAVKMATDFNAGMANVATLIPGNTARVNTLKTAVQDMAVATGKSTSDLTAGLYQTVSAFGDTADTVKILEINARAATAGLATTEEAINLTSAVTKAYGDTSAAAVQKASDLAFVTVKLGQTTFPELASAIGKVAPIAATLKVRQEELAAGFATLTGVTGTSSEVSTQLRGVLTSMLKPTKEMDAAIAALGFSSSSAMVEQLGMVGAMNAVIGTTNGSEKAIGKLFGNVESLNAVFALTGGQAGTFATKLAETERASGTTDEAVREQTEGVNKAGHEWNQFKQEIVVTAQRLGDTLIPHVQRAAEALKPLWSGVMTMVEWFGRLPQPVQTVAVGIGALVIAAAPLAIALGSLITLAGHTVTALGTLAGAGGLAGATTAATVAAPAVAGVGVAARTAAVGVGTLRTATGFLFGPVGLFVTGLAVLAALGKYLHDNYPPAADQARKHTDLLAKSQFDYNAALRAGLPQITATAADIELLAAHTLTYADRMRDAGVVVGTTIAAIEGLGHSTRRSTVLTEEQIKELEKLEAQGRAWVNALEEMRFAEIAAQQEFERSGRRIADYTALIHTGVGNLSQFIRTQSVLPGLVRENGEVILESSINWDAFTLAMDKNAVVMGHWMMTLNQAEQQARQSTGAFGGFFGGLKGGFKDLVHGMTGGKGISGFMNGIGGGIVQGLGNIVSGGLSSVIGMATDLAMKGLSKLGGWIKGVFGIGKSEGRLQLDAANADIAKLQDNLLKTHGSIDRIRQVGGAAGEALAAAWGSQNREGLAHFTTLVGEFTKEMERQKTVAALVNQVLGTDQRDRLRDLEAAYNQLTPEQLGNQRVVDNLVRMYRQLRDATGEVIPELEELSDTHDANTRATERNRREADLARGSFATLTGNLSIFQAKMANTESIRRMQDQISSLRRGGEVDMGALIGEFDRLRESVGTNHPAIKAIDEVLVEFANTGVFNFEKISGALATLGLNFRNFFSDAQAGARATAAEFARLNAIKFGKEQAQVRGLSDQELVNRIQRFFQGQAAQDFGVDRDLLTREQIASRADWDRLSSGLGIDQATIDRLRGGDWNFFAHGTPDLDFMPFGRGQFARLHGDEAVIPRGGGHQLAAEMAAAMGGGGRERIEIRVVTQLDGRVLAEELVPVLPGALKRRGFRL